MAEQKFCLLTFTWDAVADGIPFPKAYSLDIDGGAGKHVFNEGQTGTLSYEVQWPQGRTVHAELRFLWELGLRKMWWYGNPVALDFVTPTGPNVTGPNPQIDQIQARELPPEYDDATVSWESFFNWMKTTGASVWGGLIFVNYQNSKVIITGDSLPEPIVYTYEDSTQIQTTVSLPLGRKFHLEVTHYFSVVGVDKSVTLGDDFSTGLPYVPTNFRVSIAGVCAVSSIIMEHSGFTPMGDPPPSPAPSKITCNRIAGTNEYFGAGGSGTVELYGQSFTGRFYASVSCVNGVYTGYSYLRVITGPVPEIAFIMLGLITSPLAANQTAETTYVSASEWPGPNNGNVNNVKSTQWDGGSITFR